MTIGTVRDLRLDQQDAQQHVVAEVEMHKDVSEYLRSETRFWLVKPSVTLAGITGLRRLYLATISVSVRRAASRPGDSSPWRRNRQFPMRAPGCT